MSHQPLASQSVEALSSTHRHTCQISSIFFALRFLRLGGASLRIESWVESQCRVCHYHRRLVCGQCMHARRSIRTEHKHSRLVLTHTTKHLKDSWSPGPDRRGKNHRPPTIPPLAKAFNEYGRVCPTAGSYPGTYPHVLAGPRGIKGACAHSQLDTPDRRISSRS